MAIGIIRFIIASLFALHSLLFTLCSSLFALHSLLFTLHSLLFTLHSLLFTLCFQLSLILGSIYWYARSARKFTATTSDAIMTTIACTTG